MKFPEPPPDWTTIFRKDPEKFLNGINDPDMKALIARANDDYLAWEKAKYIDAGGKTDNETLWGMIKYTRTSNMRNIPLADTKGNPFGYWLPDSVQKEMHYIDRFAGGHIFMDSPDHSREARERYLISSLMEEAIASSQIEGAATTRKAAKEMLRGGRSPRTHAERMVLNNYLTIRKIKDLKGKPLTVDMLHDLQRSMTEGTLADPTAAGRFRNAGEEVIVADGSDNTILHVPPPAGELPERMEKFLAFANDTKNDPFIHPVVRAILLHFWLAYDHPYVDGNGRTARAVFYWYMLSRNYYLFEYISISRIIRKTLTQYGKAYLHAEQDRCDATYFLVYHLRIIHLALEELVLYISRKRKEMAQASRLLRGVPELNYRQQALLQHALKHPDAVYTVDSHKNSHDVVWATASSDLNELVEKGFLEKTRRSRRYYFLVREDLSERIGSGKFPENG